MAQLSSGGQPPYSPEEDEHWLVKFVGKAKDTLFGIKFGKALAAIVVVWAWMRGNKKTIAILAVCGLLAPILVPALLDFYVYGNRLDVERELDPPTVYYSYVVDVTLFDPEVRPLVEFWNPDAQDGSMRSDIALAVAAVNLAADRLEKFDETVLGRDNFTTVVIRTKLVKTPPPGEKPVLPKSSKPAEGEKPKEGEKPQADPEPTHSAILVVYFISREKGEKDEEGQPVYTIVERRPSLTEDKFRFLVKGFKAATGRKVTFDEVQEAVIGKVNGPG